MIPPSSRAEEIANELISKFSGMTFSGGLGTAWLKTEIAKALEAYAVEYANAKVLKAEGK